MVDKKESQSKISASRGAYDYSKRYLGNIADDYVMVTNKKEHIYHAAMLDPLTGANLSIDEIYSMVDKLIDAHGNYLPKYH